MQDMKSETEIWKPIPDFEGLYEISSLGKVKRLARTSGKGKWSLGEMYLSPSKITNNTFQVSLRKDGVTKNLSVAKIYRLVFGCTLNEHVDPPTETKKTLTQRIALFIIKIATKYAQ
jgi:hypothetical protein